MQTAGDESEVRPMPIVFPVLRSCNVTNLSEKVIKQLRVQMILLMEIRLKGHLGV